MRAAGSDDPASITPTQSTMARLAASTAAGVTSSHRLFTTNSASTDVTRMAASITRKPSTRRGDLLRIASSRTRHQASPVLGFWYCFEDDLSVTGLDAATTRAPGDRGGSGDGPPR